MNSRHNNQKDIRTNINIRKKNQKYIKTNINIRKIIK